MFSSQQLRTWLLSLNPTEAVALIRRLLIAEAGRSNAAAGAVSMPGNVFRPDGGVDGHSDLPANALEPFPVGRWSWQAKATERIDFDAELAKPAVREDLSHGRDYLIIASREWTAPIRERRAADLSAAVGRIAPGRSGRLLALEDIERMIDIHPGVPAQLGGPAPLGLSLAEWGRPLETNSYPFAPDGPRARLIEDIRAFATGTGASVHLHIFGDSGVGKSRAVFEALKEPVIVDRVVAHLDYSDAAPAAVVAAARSATTHVIMVVDEVEPYEAERLAAAASIADGRIRLITIGDRVSRRDRGDAASLEVAPLEEGIVTSLVERVTGLAPEDARLVADLTEGFPKLAILLATAVRESPDRGSITALLRGRGLNGLLGSMIADEATRRDLAHLALVSRIGFDDELAVETSQLCAAFELEERHFRATIARETGRFVATAGRYRRVSPGALAVWLAQELIENGPDAFVEHVTALPNSLFDGFRTQLQMLGGDPLLDDIIAGVVARRASTFRTLSELTSSDANLLNAVAFAAPEVAAPVIRALVEATAPEAVHAFDGDQRRALVWALQHLLWFDTTFENAATALLALAVGENESWANNATGVLTDAFQVVLGGTEVSLPRRFEWLESHLNDFGNPSRRLAVQLFGAALRTHESRGGNWQGARLQPVEWQPATNDELIALHRHAFETVTRLALADADLSDAVARLVGDSLWLTVRTGELASFDAAARAVNWAAPGRSDLTTKVVRELRLNTDLDEPSRHTLELLLEHLRGSSPRSRLELLLAVEVWDLERNAQPGEPSTELVAVADQMSAGGPEELIETVLAAQDRNVSTTVALFQVLGQRHPELGALAGSNRLPPEARVGFVAGLALSNWPLAEGVIRSWQGSPEEARLLPWLVAMLPASPWLVEVAVTAVNSGHAPLSELNRLRYGRWAGSLPIASVVQIVDAYVAQAPTPSDLEAAVGLVDSWLDEHATDAVELTQRGTCLIELAGAAAGNGVMLEFMRNSLADRLALPVAVRLPITIAAIAASDRAEGEDVKAIAHMANREPAVVVPAVSDLVLEPNPRRILLESAHLLSVVGAAAGAEVVAAHILTRSRDEQVQALRHLDLAAPPPDPVMAALLEHWCDDEEAIQQAVSRFVFPGEVVRGPYSRRLQERRDEADAVAHSHPSPAVRRWATEAVATLDEFIASQITREAERDV